MKTLNDQIQRLRDVLVTCYNTIKRKGGTIPVVGERNMSNLPAAVLSIPQIHSVLTDLEVTANGDYLPADYDADGFSKVTVSVEPNPDIRVNDGCYYEDGSRVPYGISLLHLLSSDNQITMIEDNDIWECFTNKALFSVLPNCKKFRINCKRIAPETLSKGFIPNTVEEIEMPYLEEVEAMSNVQLFSSENHHIKKVYLPLFLGFTKDIYYIGIISQSNSLEELIMPKFCRIYGSGGTQSNTDIRNNPILRKVVFGKIEASKGQPYNYFLGCPQMIHFEIGEGTDISINIAGWNPTTALMSDNSEEGYVDLREDTKFANNLEQFLYNFKTYIAERVADRTGKTALTLTLSAAVYGVLTDEIKAILTSKNWTIAQA